MMKSGLESRSGTGFRRGSVGLIMVILILGFLMVVAMSGSLLIQSETQATMANRDAEKAKAASQAGIVFYMGILGATETTFVGDPKQRWHFLSENIRNNSALGNQQIVLNDGSLPAWTFPNAATSGWMYASGASSLYPSTIDEVPSSSLFMIKTFVDEPNVGTYVYVKSIGAFRQIEGANVIATSYAEFVGRVQIATVSSRITLNRLRQTAIEGATSPTSPFHQNLYNLWND